MCVTGEECCDGSSLSSDANEFQYFCSDVRVEGPFGSFKGCRSCTSAAIVRVGCDQCACSCKYRELLGSRNFSVGREFALTTSDGGAFLAWARADADSVVDINIEEPPEFTFASCVASCLLEDNLFAISCSAHRDANPSRYAA